VISTTTDNQKWLPKLEIFMSKNMRDSIDIPTAKLGFTTTKLEDSAGK